ncbi:MAG: hypothetical protein ABSF21_00845 [Dehalococcoidia bacterium]
MGVKNISSIRATVRQLLRDEYLSGSPFEFDDEELNVHIGEVLIEISEYKSQEVRETVVSNGTKEVDISTITNLLEIIKVEYPIGSDPQDFVKFTVFGNTLRIEDTTPALGANIYLYCYKAHQLTESTSSLSPDLERVLVEGTVAKAALAWVNNIRTQTNLAISTIDTISTTIGSMDARITQAINDLASGRVLIGSKKTETNTAIGNMTTRISQAINDLTSGRALINKINIGGAPENDYAQYAAVELNNAARYLEQSRGYLSEDTPSSEYGNYAARELNNAVAYLNKATGYFRTLTAQLDVAASATRYQAWANNQLMIYQNSLRMITKPKVWEY